MEIKEEFFNPPLDSAAKNQYIFFTNLKPEIEKSPEFLSSDLSHKEEDTGEISLPPQIEEFLEDPSSGEESREMINSIIRNLAAQEASQNAIANLPPITDVNYSATPEEKLTEREKIIALWKNGIRNYCQIARELGVCRHTVRKWIVRYSRGGYLLNHYGGGAKRSTTTEQDDAIVKLIQERPDATANDIAVELNLSTSVYTVRKRMRDGGRKIYKPTLRPLLKEDLRQQRLAFAQAHQNEGLDFWKRVIFTDEKSWSSICIFNKYRIGEEERQSERTNGGMWGWFSYSGLGELVEIEGTLTAHEYVRIVDEVLLPSVKALFGEECGPILVVHNRSRIHMSRLLDCWIQDHPEFTFLNWPPMGVDLNPVKTLWCVLIQEWSEEVVMMGNNGNHLFSEVHRVWENLRRNPIIMENLVDSMPNRIKECINQGGSFTRY